MTTTPPEKSSDRPIPWWKSALPWIAAGVIAGPVSVVLHELGHHVAALLFGFQGATLHYFSATYASEQAMLDLMAQGDRIGVAAVNPLWQIAVNAGAGPAVGYFLILPVCLLAVYIKPDPFFITLGMTPLLRAFPEAMTAISAPQMLDDENTAAFAMGLPPTVLHVVGLFISLAAAIWLARRIPASRRSAALLSMMAGILAGAVIYIGFLGPWLLP
jgi:hypothetical protein